ncbi:FAST kinase domain-containing protein 5, mitochondrial [Pseudolycoriella hygida]|uniref:FAST kinase domain-containing protein 5, mitochondrial n=1 Tax=Pseudolycoriella hygida TaxID=35572 RepID=A0A9Q0MTT4_9DIPT|nr:FAST kinase domain-containing protein 5, mitochondrial [Pseudolycoriella hygida]
MFYTRKCFHICKRLFKLPNGSSFIRKSTENRQFRTSAAVSKLYTSSENAFAHGILEQNARCHVLRGEQNIESDSKYAKVDVSRNWSNCNTADVLEHLHLIIRYCNINGLSITDERFDEFVDACTERCFEFTDNELIKSLQILSKYSQTHHSQSRNFVEIWNALDDACVQRIDQWDFDKTLYVCDHWYILHLGGINKFNVNATRKIGRKLRKIPPHQLLQMMFYINVLRSPAVHDMIDFEINLFRSIDQLSLNEISVMCIGFFKTQTKVHNPELVGKIIQRLISEIDTVQDIPLSCILKTLRYSAVIKHVDLIEKLMEAVNVQIHRLNTYSCLHLALLGTNLHICHQNLIEQVILRFVTHIKSIRIKDFERIANVIGFFDFETESKIENELCRGILTELKNRIDEITNHPKCFSLCINFLTMKGYYDEEMINVIFGQQFLLHAYSNLYLFGKELFSLDAFTKINLKDTYRGNQLSEKSRQYLGKMKTLYVPDRNRNNKISATDLILLEVKEATEKLIGHCTLTHALPHHDRADVIFVYNKITKATIDVTQNFPEIYTGVIIDRSMLIKGIDASPSDVEAINIIIGGWNHFVRHTNKLTGPLKLKLEQSKLLGLQPILIPWFEWQRLLDVERTHYIEHKIYAVLQGKSLF